MKILSIVGARPQFVKMAVIARAVKEASVRHSALRHRIVHTGQHYDFQMSDVFFEELGIDAPDHHLGAGSGSHGEQTGEMLKRLEPVLVHENPDWVVLYGDTNSTLAGAVAASKLGFKLAHVEAGLRSFNRRMPEEMNRIVADHLSDLLLCPTAAALENSAREGLAGRAVLTGDVMLDATLIYRAEAEERKADFAAGWPPGSFALATVHRAENTDDPERLRNIFSALDHVAAEICPVVLPLHPRTRKVMERFGCSPRKVRILPACSYLEMLLLESRARFILTDSGGIQKEAYFVKVPCITLRDETEWVETLENRCNTLTGADPDRIFRAARDTVSAGPWLAAYGDGRSGRRIIEMLTGATPAEAGSAGGAGESARRQLTST
jgi:UDP-GlcNAc3NAcA epimerase